MPAANRPIAYVMLVALALSVGCVGGRQWNPFAEAYAPVLSPGSDCQQVVAHLNANISRCTGWRSTSVKVQSNGSALSASAMMAVESPQRFRMLVTALGADLADLGSNDERMWMWMRPPTNEASYVLTCAHSDLAAAQQRMSIPFRPDWLMEVLGVIPIDPSTVELEVNPGDAGEFLLVSYQKAADGTPLKRVMTVDATKGVIVGHALWSVTPDSARLVAQAKLSDHRRDERTGVLLPHVIELSYPDPAGRNEMTMTLSIKSIEVNPTDVSPNTWQPSVAASYPWLDLATNRVVTLEPPGAF